MGVTEPKSASIAGAPDGLIRVMVVDDSVVVRGLISRFLKADANVDVVASVADGEMALRALESKDIDLVLLDIEMPRMDGLTALPKMIELRNDLQVIMVSTLTLKNAEISLKALELGATDYITKPSAEGSLHSAEEFQRELIQKVVTLGRVARRRRLAAAAETGAGVTPTDDSEVVRERQKVANRTMKTVLDSMPLGDFLPPEPKAEAPLRPASTLKPVILAIGSSTGGPQALFEVVSGLGTDIGVPILITQHMPATFTTILADHIAKASGLPCTEAEDGAALESGHVYLAPGDHHMLVTNTSGRPSVRLTDDEPVNFCRPAVDPMLRSVAEVYGGKVLTIILTGMGQDGLRGSETIVDAGGTIIAQDEETSVVWGMPGAVATRGLCSAVLPLTDIAAHARQLVRGGSA